ncbi:MAG: amidohydrolase [Bacteroidetes bacterium HGW-Bacteroidetes-16]|nr:MAG: amidohydrolase [Bacteroidetes bacterium HGW-Bacteroidetes-16]
MSNMELITLRHKLHQNPELSNQEFRTSEHISAFIQQLHPDEVILLGKTGKAFVFNGKQPGKTIVFRAELDALPITEISDKPYQSVNEKVAHSCGHDGHMTIVAGLAQRIAENRPVRGRAVLLFQPAEEVEQGARDVVEDPEFQKLKPDYIFGLHNVPGKKANSILVKPGSFAAASTGMTIKLTGKTSHAAEPENGISPAMAISRIIHRLHQLSDSSVLFKDMVLLTIVHVMLGEIAFGTSPGYAEIRVTLRAFENEDMELFTANTEKLVREIAHAEKLACEIGWSEVFPATVNHPECIQMIEQSAIDLGLSVENLQTPFKWSEDFAYYTGIYRGGFFGLGAGVHHPQLHNPEYDFPDEIMDTGISMFFNLYEKLLVSPSE